MVISRNERMLARLNATDDRDLLAKSRRMIGTGLQGRRLVCCCSRHPAAHRALAGNLGDDSS
jgi:hypothetical protein